MGEERAAVRGTDELCREIDSTRRRIQEQAGLLRNRMTAKELARPVTDRLKGTLGAGGEKILDAFRDNPVPIALVGIGLGWLMLRDSGFLYRSRGTGPRLRSVTRSAREAAETVGEAAGAVSEKMSDLAGSVSEKVSGMAGTVSEKVGGMAHQTQEAAHQAKESVRRGATRTADWFSRTLEENPFVLAAGALAAGLVAGLAIPVGEEEQETLGKIGEQVAQKVLDQVPQGEAPAAEEASRQEVPAEEPKKIGEGGTTPPPAGQGPSSSVEPHLG